MDESTMGLLAHVNRREALLSLQVALEKKAKEIGAALIVWKDFPESFTDELDWLSHKRRLFRVISFPGTLAELPSLTKEDYFAAMKGSDRRNLKRKLRRSREQVSLSIEIVHHPAARPLDEF